MENKDSIDTTVHDAVVIKDDFLRSLFETTPEERRKRFIEIQETVVGCQVQEPQVIVVGVIGDAHIGMIATAIHEHLRHFDPVIADPHDQAQEIFSKKKKSRVHELLGFLDGLVEADLRMSPVLMVTTSPYFEDMSMIIEEELLNIIFTESNIVFPVVRVASATKSHCVLSTKIWQARPPPFSVILFYRKKSLIIYSYSPSVASCGRGIFYILNHHLAFQALLLSKEEI